MNLNEAWRNTYVSTVMAGQLALGEVVKNVFDLSTVMGLITTKKEVIKSPFEMQTMPGISKVTGHIKWVDIITEPREQGFSNEVVATHRVLFIALDESDRQLKDSIACQMLTQIQIVRQKRKCMTCFSV